MLFNTGLASTIALAIGIFADPAPQDDSRYVQLRIYSEPGYLWHTTVNSVCFEHMLCNDSTVAIYNDVTCHCNRHNVEINTCLSNDKEHSDYFG
ncbi:uncharacterized protein BDW43DRAFT_314768 [Aspergillus alliaceus]|uniref:uncharacterized protein n=1 Tax=Petromyces alliaceus TaxID=209559 RepID=UPI0012A60A2D|nr:uncharacterized protein BDW43DRAFT_314768 [Aspergillus alliaceus]KAB8229568.1 hypothetical protein BDW43DRAFT_314768 [Aspergillus alliaceus]